MRARDATQVSIPVRSFTSTQTTHLKNRVGSGHAGEGGSLYCIKLSSRSDYSLRKSKLTTDLLKVVVKR